KNTENLKENPSSYKEKADETYEEVKKFFENYGGKYHEEVNEVYNEYNSSSPLIVRRENPSLIIDLLNGQDIEMKFDPDVVGERGDKYANCALWPHGSIEKTSGIANAFLEGRGNAGPIVMVAGYKNDGEHMVIEEPAEKMLSVGTISRENVKILSGKIKPADLRFVILRMPVKFFNEGKLTKIEKERLEKGQLAQIFRGFTF
ncbi:hypothetical protein IT397_02705, partial [Candidatus Nomurabacteria bacterium]|nr:hypothetical protein [Candidatus Nomurabacteria bacterium]